MNDQNLRPSEYKFTDADREKARRVRQENLKRRKTFAEVFEAFLAKDYKDKKGNKMTGAEALGMKVIEQAMKGELKAFELIRDTVGEKPVEKVATVEIPDDVRSKVENLVSDYESDNGVQGTNGTTC